MPSPVDILRLLLQTVEECCNYPRVALNTTRVHKERKYSLTVLLFGVHVQCWQKSELLELLTRC